MAYMVRQKNYTSGAKRVLSYSLIYLPGAQAGLTDSLANRA